MSKQIEGMNLEIKALADREGKYLTFILADEEYGISIMKIQEIIGVAVPEFRVPGDNG